MNRIQPAGAPIGLQPTSVVDASLGAHFKVFDFSDADFLRLRKMIFDYAGI